MKLAGVELQPCLSGAMYAPAHDALLVADLHLEKGSSKAHHGVFLPPYDTKAGLLSLIDIIGKWQPERVILLGDSFHDVAGPQRMSDDDMGLLDRATAMADFTWLSGNHDPQLPDYIKGIHLNETTLGGLTLRHEPLPEAANEVAGHLHPVACVRQRGRKIRAKCFVKTTQRIIMPSFGAYTGGLDVTHEAFSKLLPGRDFQAIMIGRTTLHTVSGKVVIKQA